MSEIYVVRHGQASFGEGDYDRLSPLGVRQSELLGDYWTCRGLKFDSIYTGMMKRHIDTAANVLARMPGGVTQVRRSAAFNEYDYLFVLKSQIPLLLADDPQLAEALPRLHSDRLIFQQVFERAVAGWVGGRPGEGVGETWRQYVERVQDGVRQVMLENGSGRKIAVFTSGGCAALFMQMALALSDQKTVELSWLVCNASVSIFKYSQRGIGLSCFNSTAHLELADDIQLITYR